MLETIQYARHQRLKSSNTLPNIASNGCVCGKKARNATFLFTATIWDYHSDRFKDYSLMFSQERKTPFPLPAHERGYILLTLGLTYGGPDNE